MAHNVSPAGRPRGIACPPVQRPPRRLLLDDVVAALRELRLTDQPLKCPPGRTFNRDFRIAVHEIGHLLVARLLGDRVDGVTIEPSEQCDGQVWGPWRFKAFARGDVDAAEIRTVFQPLMPRAGEDHFSAAEVTAQVMNQVVQFMAGLAAEKLVLRGRPSPSMDDDRQARELAAIICASPKSIDRLLTFCEQQAEDLLTPYIDLIFALVPVLRVKRTMTGQEADQAIAVILRQLDMSAERARRRDWERRIENAKTFKRD